MISLIDMCSTEVRWCRWVFIKRVSDKCGLFVYVFMEKREKKTKKKTQTHVVYDNSLQKNIFGPEKGLHLLVVG